MKTNYHTHTPRCKHAVGSEEEYILTAIKEGFQEIGFSDHSPWPYEQKDFVPTIRMDISELKNYLETLRSLREKYKDQIKIYIGLECEYFPKYMDWLKATIKEEKLDYVILGAHYAETDESNPYLGRYCKTTKGLDVYLNSCLNGMRTGIYSYLAHPDLFMSGYQKWDEHSIAVSRRICEVAKELDMPLEYNLNGYIVFKERGVVGYPYPDFWKLAAEMGNKVILGYDAHDPAFLEKNEDVRESLDFLNSIGCNIIDSIKLTK